MRPTYDPNRYGRSSSDWSRQRRSGMGGEHEDERDFEPSERRERWGEREDWMRSGRYGESPRGYGSEPQRGYGGYEGSRGYSERGYTSEAERGESRYYEPRYGEPRHVREGREREGWQGERGGYGGTEWGRESGSRESRESREGRWTGSRPYGETRGYGGGYGTGLGGGYGGPSGYGGSGYGPDYGGSTGSWSPAWQGEAGRGGSTMQQGPHQGKGPRNYQRSDSRIQEDLCDRLTDDPMIDASGIECSVKDGEITLTGTVGSREEKRRAEDIAESLTGVKEVNNQIRVRRRESTEWSSSRTGYGPENEERGRSMSESHATTQASGPTPGSGSGSATTGKSR